MTNTTAQIQRSALVLSICTGMGLLDRAFLNEGFEIIPGCEIDPAMRHLYKELCGDGYVAHSLGELIEWSKNRSGLFGGVIGGPPCQASSRLSSLRPPKYPDLSQEVQMLLEYIRPQWFLFENVTPMKIVSATHTKLNAMHFAKPHQSRSRWFTHSSNIEPPKPIYYGSTLDLLAYPIVAGRIYGTPRAAILQGYPAAAKLSAPSETIQRGLANAVHYELASAWARRVKQLL